MTEKKQKLYIMDSNGLPMGYVFMNEDVLYSLDDKVVKQVSKDTTLSQLQETLTKEKTPYIA